MTEPDRPEPAPEPVPGPDAADPDEHNEEAPQDATAEPADPDPDTDPDTAFDLPDSDRAYVMASLTRLSGDYTDISSRLRVAEDRIEDLAVGLDGIEDAATSTAAAAGTGAAAGDTDDAGPDTDDSTGAFTGESGGAGSDNDDTDDRGGIDMVELVSWVRDHITLLLERKLPQTGTPPHWCRKWWMHAEAIARFEALRRGWVEAVASDGNAMVVWFEHLDLMLSVLMGDGGTFSGCTNGEHRPGAVRMLGHDEPDAAYFADFDLLDTG